MATFNKRTHTPNWKFIMLDTPQPLTQLAACIYLFTFKSNANQKKSKVESL